MLKNRKTKLFYFSSGFATKDRKIPKNKEFAKEFTQTTEDKADVAAEFIYNDNSGFGVYDIVKIKEKEWEEWIDIPSVRVYLPKPKEDKKMKQKSLDISEVKEAKKNISNLKVYGDGDTFRLLCKASSQEEGWMKSTKVMNVPGGCVVQVTTQQQNPDGSYAVAEALTYVPGCHIDKDTNPRRIVSIEELAKREAIRKEREPKQGYSRKDIAD